jgi:hypothetical protein
MHNHPAVSAFFRGQQGLLSSPAVTRSHIIACNILSLDCLFVALVLQQQHMGQYGTDKMVPSCAMCGCCSNKAADGAAT